MTRAPYISVDTDVDAAYIGLTDDPVCETLEVYNGILIDLDEAGHVVGIEFLRPDVVGALDRILAHMSGLIK